MRKIFDLYIQGNGFRKIKKYLESHGIKTVTGKSEWSTSTIDRMLSNEKYAGDDAEDLHAGFPDWQKGEEPWVGGEVPGGERP